MNDEPPSSSSSPSLNALHRLLSRTTPTKHVTAIPRSKLEEIVAKVDGLAGMDSEGLGNDVTSCGMV